MTTPHPFAALLQSLSQLSDEGYVGPFRHDAKGAMVWCGKDGQTHALDVRGWGHLTGRRRMAEENAEAVYTAFGEKVALLLTAAPEVAALVEAVEAYRVSVGRYDECAKAHPVGPHLAVLERQENTARGAMFAALDALDRAARDATSGPADPTRIEGSPK